MSEWQAMETAPKSGTEILVCYKNQGNVMQLVSFDRVYSLWKSKGEPVFGLEQNATHWMPLPDAPK